VSLRVKPSRERPAKPPAPTVGKAAVGEAAPTVPTVRSRAERSLGRRTLLGAIAAATLAPRAAALAAAGGILGTGRAFAAASALDELLARRRMVRKFKRDDVSEALVRRLLRAATRAPSAGNRQPWLFVVVRARKTKALLGRAALGQMFVAEAPVVIVACADVPRARARYRERGAQYAVIDTAFASLCLLLAATEAGLGACFVGAFHDAEVARVLRLPAEIKPLAVIPIGWPAETPKAMRLRRLDDVVHAELYRAPETSSP
jgi:nitroreductase